MKNNTRIEVPAVAWWVLAALLIPVLQVWIETTFPGSSFVWAPLVVGALGAVLKWINWVMQQNRSKTMLAMCIPLSREASCLDRTVRIDVFGEPNYTPARQLGQFGLGWLLAVHHAGHAPHPQGSR